MCKRFPSAVEHHCKGLTAISSGVIGSCSECQSAYGMKLEFRDTEVVNRNLQLKSGHVLVNGSEVQWEGPTDDLSDRELHDALWDEWRFGVQDIPEKELNAIFDERVSNGEYPSEGRFSRSDCDTCGSGMAGNRFDGHARIEETNELIHLSMCEECLFG